MLTLPTFDKLIVMTNNNDFPGKLRGLLGDAGLTQTELAKRAGLSRYTVNKLVTDPQHKPTAETLTAIAQVLRMPVSELYRMAGLQPGRSTNGRIDRAVYLLEQLGEFDQDEVIEILELKVKRRENFRDSDWLIERLRSISNDETLKSVYNALMSLGAHRIR